MAALNGFNAVMKKYQKNVDFKIIYIAEAHSSDEWALKIDVQPDVNQPKTMEERMDACKVMVDSINFDVDVFVDSMKNSACTTFGAMPERLFVLKDGPVEFIGGTGPQNYSLEALTDFLESAGYNKDQSGSNETSHQNNIEAAESC